MRKAYVAVLMCMMAVMMMLVGCSSSSEESQAQKESQGQESSQTKESSQAEGAGGSGEEVSVVLAEIANPTIPEIEEGVTHIACIGDSITFGHGVWVVEASKENTYPAYLERMMGDGYQALNYGVCGKTLLEEGDQPYTAHYLYDESVQANSEVYVIMLGTNDSKPYNWNAERFGPELRDFVQAYIDLESSPKVYLATPPRAFEEGEEAFNVDNDTIENEIVPVVREVAEEMGVTLIDIYGETKDHPEWFMDGIHPNAEGNREFAKIFASCFVRMK